MSTQIDITYVPFKLLFLSGQDVFSNNWIFTLFDSIIIVSCFILTLMEPVLHYKGPETWAGALEVGGPSHQWITKMLIYKIFKKTFLKLIDDMHQFWPHNVEGPKLENRLHKMFLLVTRGFWIFFWCSAVASALMAIKPLLTMVFDDNDSGRQLPVVVYHFIDLNKTPYYEIAYICHVIYLYIILTFVVGFDGMFLALCISASSQLMLLKHSLAHMKPEPQNECKKMIKKYVDYHNFILEFLKEIRKLFSLLLLNQFLSSVVCVCMAIYLTCSKGLTDFVFIARCGLFALAGIIQIFIYCVTGTHIKTQMESVSDAIYLSPWWTESKPPFHLRQAVLLITQRAQMTATFKAGGMVDLDLQSFVAILRMSFSFFTLMQSTANTLNN